MSSVEAGINQGETISTNKFIHRAVGNHGHHDDCHRDRNCAVRLFAVICLGWIYHCCVLQRRRMHVRLRAGLPVGFMVGTSERPVPMVEVGRYLGIGGALIMRRSGYWKR